MKAMKATQAEMASAVATDKIRTALSRSIFGAADTEIVEGFKVRMFKDRPIGKWIEPYILNKRDGKMLILDTGDRFLSSSIDRVKLYVNSDFIASDSFLYADLIQRKS